MTSGFRPTLLLSMPQMQDPNFARTVVLLRGGMAGVAERRAVVGALRSDDRPVAAYQDGPNLDVGIYVCATAGCPCAGWADATPTTRPLIAARANPCIFIRVSRSRRPPTSRRPRSGRPRQKHTRWRMQGGGKTGVGTPRALGWLRYVRVIRP